MLKAAKTREREKDIGLEGRRRVSEARSAHSSATDGEATKQLHDMMLGRASVQFQSMFTVGRCTTPLKSGK